MLRSYTSINLSSVSLECEIRLEIGFDGSKPVFSLGSTSYGVCIIIRGHSHCIHPLPRQFLTHKTILQAEQPAQGQVIHGCRWALASL